MKNTGFLNEDEIRLGQEALGRAMGRSARRYVAVVLCLGLSFCLGSWPLLAQSQRPADWVTDDKPLDVDNDDDGLIEIWNLADLNNVRNSLDGTKYSDGTDETSAGCPREGCHGYELMNNLDFRERGAWMGSQKAWMAYDNADPDANGARRVDDPALGKNEGWTPIGTSTSKDFSGTFEGNGKVIKNLYINVSAADSQFVGLFRSNTGTVRNLGLTGSHMHVSGSTSGGGMLVGGIAGLSNNAEITNCYVTGNVTAKATGGARDAYAGGLVGFIPKGTHTITGSYATGNVTAEAADYYPFAGGLVGIFYDGKNTITNSYATGNVTARTAGAVYVFSGGLIGYIRTGTNDITGSYATGNVKAISTGSNPVYTGGLVGIIHGGKNTITNVYATGNVTARAHGTGNSTAGGLVGESFSGTSTLTNGYATGDVSATATAADRIFAGGVLARNNSNSATVTACYYAGAVKKSLGFVGTNSAYRTLAQLKALVAGAVDANDLTKSGWDAKDWDFGDNTKLPRLRSYKETNGVQVQGEVLDGQEMLEREVNRITDTSRLGRKVTELDELLGNAGQSAAVDGSVYQRVKHLMEEISALKLSGGGNSGGGNGNGGSTPDLSVYLTKEAAKTMYALIDASHTKAESDDKFALKSEVGEKPEDGTAETLWQEVLSVKGSIPDVSGKADVGDAYTKAESDDKYALSSEVGEKPDGTADTLWSEVLSVRDLANGKSDTDRSYTKEEARSMFALKSEVPDVSGKADRGFSYTKAEVNAKEASLKSEIEALREALDELKKQVGSGSVARVAARLEMRIVVRPNPAGEVLVIEGALGQLYKVLDAAGQVLMEGRVVSRKQELRVGRLPVGQYVIFFQKGAATATHVFVKE